MICKIDRHRTKVDVHDLNNDGMYMGLMSLQELKECYKVLNITDSSLRKCEERSMVNQNSFTSNRRYDYGIVNLINGKDIYKNKDTFVFFIFKNLFLIVVVDDEDSHISKVYKKVSQSTIAENASMAKIVYTFFNELLVDDYSYIELLQERIESLDDLEEDETIEFSEKVKDLHKELLLLRNYYDNLVVIGEELEMNHHRMFEADEVRYIEIFTRRIERLINSIQMLRELLIQAKDTHQAQLDYQLNKTMQFFTIVTTIFLPLTLIAGWYGMNFENMPELHSPYGYLGVIVLSIVIVIGLIFWFKKKNFL